MGLRTVIRQAARAPRYTQLRVAQMFVCQYLTLVMLTPVVLVYGFGWPTGPEKVWRWYENFGGQLDVVLHYNWFLAFSPTILFIFGLLDLKLNSPRRLLVFGVDVFAIFTFYAYSMALLFRTPHDLSTLFQRAKEVAGSRSEPYHLTVVLLALNRLSLSMAASVALGVSVLLAVMNWRENRKGPAGARRESLTERRENYEREWRSNA